MTDEAVRARPVIAVVGEVVADAVSGAVSGATAGGEPEINSHQSGIGPSATPHDDRSAAAAAETLSLTVHPGGGPANAALALARLGAVARFAGRLSTGALGTLCRLRLEASGVDLSASVAVSEPATLAIATLSEDGSAAYEFYTDGTADWHWTADELKRLLDPAVGPTPAAVHAGSLALAMSPSGQRIESLLAAASPAATISIDPNLRTSLIPVERYRQAVPQWARLADIVKLSADDLAELWPGIAMADAARRLHEHGAPLVVITCGADGAYASMAQPGTEPADAEVVVQVPPVHTAVVDTVGAGDSFAAGLLHHLGASGALGGRLTTLSVESLRAAVVFASRVAAITCSRPGADPPWARELA